MESSSMQRISVSSASTTEISSGARGSLRELFSEDFDLASLDSKIQQAEFACTCLLKRVENSNSHRIKLLCSKQKCPLSVKLEFSATTQKYHLRELNETHNHQVSKEKFQEKLLTSRLLRYQDFIYETYFLTESEFASKPKLILKDLKIKHSIDIMVGNFSLQQKQKLKKKFDNIIQQLRLKKSKAEPATATTKKSSLTPKISSKKQRKIKEDFSHAELNTQCKIEQGDITSDSSSSSSSSSSLSCEEDIQINGSNSNNSNLINKYDIGSSLPTMQNLPNPLFMIQPQQQQNMNLNFQWMNSIPAPDQNYLRALQLSNIQQQQQQQQYQQLQQLLLQQQQQNQQQQQQSQLPFLSFGQNQMQMPILMQQTQQQLFNMQLALLQSQQATSTPLNMLGGLNMQSIQSQ